ncbi:MAG: TolC family protein [Acidobacteria bacterium]|nr:TolC family protein [Acidobacteriota bacterium]
MRRTLAVFVLFALAARASAQTPQTFTLERALQYAGDHYPAIRAALEEVNVTSAEARVARAAPLPRLDAIWQSNRATANNIFGQVLPQSVIPAMSGPVLPSASADSVWSSATGALFSWEPFDFGLRDAAIAEADAAVTRARAGEALTRLGVQAAVGGAFLGVVAAQRAVVAAQADLDRRDVLARIVHALVDNELRPGADASRADAERAAARTRLIKAQETLTLAQTTTVRVLGLSAQATMPVTIDAANLLTQVPAADVAAEAATAHPLAQVHQAAIDVARAQEDVLARTDRPRVYLQSSVFARGGGANPSGVLDGGLGGLGLDRANWAAGIQIQFPNLFDFSSLRARRAGAAASERAEAARYDEAILTIGSQQQAALAMVQAARAVAANTPVQLAAARQSEAQARARYQAGLTNIVDVADAQSLLAQSDVQDQLARVDVWRARLAEAVARGSLAPFLTLVHP